MHNYYRAIGFGRGYLKPVLKSIINKAVEDYKKNNFEDTKGKLIEIFVHFDKSIGLAIHGEFDENDEFEVEYTFPFLKPRHYANYDDILIEKNAATYSFSAGFDNKNTGVTIIFYLQNALDYVNKKFPEKTSAPVGLSGLSLSGKIIFPTKEYKEYKTTYQQILDDKSKMIAQAQKGDENAIETLTLDEMNMYSKISKRLESEDVLSIVDTTFMPYGMECDRYTVIGNIKDIEVNINRITRERVYNLVLECNDIMMNVAINEDDLTGEPKIGRRFKGTIWLQGFVSFSSSPKKNSKLDGK